MENELTSHVRIRPHTRVQLKILGARIGAPMGLIADLAICLLLDENEAKLKRLLVEHYGNLPQPMDDEPNADTPHAATG